MDFDKCHQEGCEEPGSLKMYWPGEPIALVCIPHAEKAKKIARSLGRFHLVLEPNDPFKIESRE